jgi:hypothetical protein
MAFQWNIEGLAIDHNQQPNITTYSHRNGETEPPTRCGDYWVSDRIDGEYYEPEILHVCHYNRGSGLAVDIFDTANDNYMTPVVNVDARWWGPIEMPSWEQNV